MRTNVKRTRKK